MKNIQAIDCRSEWALQTYLRRAVTNRVRDERRRLKKVPQRADLSPELM